MDSNTLGDPMKSTSTYLTFDGNCREAMEFYAKCISGQLDIMTFASAPFDSPPEAKNRIVHARLAKGPFLLMASYCRRVSET
jgi:PhnB protein